MDAPASRLAARLLPTAGRTSSASCLLFGGAYALYTLVRGVVDTRTHQAFENARELVALERSLDLFVEPAVHGWAARQPLVIDAASWLYVSSHFTVTVLVLAWLYLFRNERFYFVRNMFMVAMGIALGGLPGLPDRAAAPAGRAGVHRLGGGLHRRALGVRRARWSTRTRRSRPCTSPSR